MGTDVWRTVEIETDVSEPGMIDAIWMFFNFYERLSNIIPMLSVLFQVWIGFYDL